MEFGNDDILRKLERPPNKNNLSLYNIIQLVLMLILCCAAGFHIIYNFLYGKSFLYYFSLISNGFLFLGAIFSFWGIATDVNATLKTGFSLFFVGCFLFIIEVIYRFCQFGFLIEYFIECLIVLILGFVIMKQIQHI